MTWLLGAAVMALVALCVLLGTGVIYFAKAALARADQRSASDTKLATHVIEDANTATATALATEKKQQERADSLEKELHDAPASDPGGALDRLSSLSDDGQPAGTHESHPER